MRAPAPARNVSVSFLMSISSQRNPKYERLNQGTRSKKIGNGHRHGTKLLMELSATMFPIGNVASDLQTGFNSIALRFAADSAFNQSRDRHDFNADRAVIFRSACQITGSTSSAAPSKTSDVTSVLPKNIESEPHDISMDWRKASSALSPITIASTSGAKG